MLLEHTLWKPFSCPCRDLTSIELEFPEVGWQGMLYPMYMLYVHWIGTCKYAIECFLPVQSCFDGLLGCLHLKQGGTRLLQDEVSRAKGCAD